MPLPVAQLGHMPNLSSPGRGPTTVIEDPWRQLAIQVLGSVVQKGISNAFEQDFTTQAQREGLPVDPTAKNNSVLKRIFTGARTDEEQLNRLRGEAAQTTRTKLSESGANKRSDAQITAGREEGIANRGFQRDENLRRSVDESNRLLATLTNNTAINEADNTARLELVDRQIAAEERALGRKLTGEEQQVVIRSFIDQAGKMTAAAPAEGLKQQILNPGAPPFDVNTNIDALAQKLQSMGFQLTPVSR